MYIHETRRRPIMEPYVLLPHTRYTEVYMDRYTQTCLRCACVHTFRSHTVPQHWPQMVTHDTCSTRRPTDLLILSSYVWLFINSIFFQIYWGGDRRPFADALEHIFNLIFIFFSFLCKSVGQSCRRIVDTHPYSCCPLRTSKGHRGRFLTRIYIGHQTKETSGGESGTYR